MPDDKFYIPWLHYQKWIILFLNTWKTPLEEEEEKKKKKK